MVAATQGAERHEYDYDGFRRRVGHTTRVGGQVVEFSRGVWCGFEACEERDGAGPVTVQRYSFGEAVNAIPYFTVSDHLGSVNAVISAAGARVSGNEYDPFGRASSTVGAHQSARTFAGGDRPHQAGMNRMVFREYAPELGRWASEDPIGLSGGANLVAYVGNNPLRYTDPLGLVAVTVHKPQIEFVRTEDIGGLCGLTVADMGLGGNCACQNGVWKASLRIVFKATIKIAMDSNLPPDFISQHEVTHYEDGLEVVRRATIDGERIEKTDFPSKAACESAKEGWKARWQGERIYAKLRNHLWKAITEWPKCTGAD